MNTKTYSTFVPVISTADHCFVVTPAMVGELNLAFPFRQIACAERLLKKFLETSNVEVLQASIGHVRNVRIVQA